MQQQLILSPNDSRWPRYPLCGHALGEGIYRRPLLRALTRPYIQANPPHLRVWSIHDCDYAGAAVAWEDRNLPPPTWAAVNRVNGHAHLVWGLTAPVLVEDKGGRRAPLRYLCAVESAFRTRLEADSGFGGLITKNPTHPLWKTLYGGYLWELGELAEYVDLPKHLPKRKPEEIGLGRNCTCFDYLRHWAYRAIREVNRHEQGSYVFWAQTCYETAMIRNGDFMNPLDHREVHHIAKSVARWVWNRFDWPDYIFETHQREQQSWRRKHQNHRTSQAIARLVALNG